MTETTEPATPDQAPTPTPTPAPATGKRYAAYDKTYLRFVGGVHDTKAKATKAAKDTGIKLGDLEVREV